MQEEEGKHGVQKDVFTYSCGKERHNARSTFRYRGASGRGSARSNALSLKKLWFIAPVTLERLKEL